ncbi:MAG: hypothetical protein JWO00_344 [Candidatus Parcubacteria bacterium]|nr:hypothetical protein [Candidatus Parcubacteria bacterium]
MSKFSGLLGSKKINSRHSTMTEDAKLLISIADAEESVTKIVLGVVKNVSGGKPHLKFNAIPAGFSVKVRGLGDVQEVFIYTKNPNVPASLQEAFDRKK